jgi:hypothetical protein
MNPVPIGIGVACLAAGIGFVLALEMYQSPRAQRLVVTNHFEDAVCLLDFYVEATERFSIKKGERYERTYKSPRIGFVLMRCTAGSRTFESPGHFRLIDGGLAEVVFTPAGEMDVRYEGVGRF